MMNQGVIDHHRAEAATIDRRRRELTALDRGEIETDPAWDGNEPAGSGAELTTLEMAAQAAREILEDEDLMDILNHREIEALRLAAGEDRMKQNLPEWFENGRQGLSSEAIALTALTGTATLAVHHPMDPSDLRRCILLLDRAP